MARTVTIERNTKETQISVQLDLDGGERCRSIPASASLTICSLPSAFMPGSALKLTAKGDLYVDGHHTVEDTGIVLGQAIREALGDRKGIRRFGSAYVPMDEALAFTALDFSNRPYLVFDAEMPQERIGEYDSCLTLEFMRAVAHNAGITLHQKCFYGVNAHHITEGLFKSFGLAVKDAVKIEGTGVTSTKGVL